MPSTPIPDARPGATLEFFEEAGRAALKANQAVALLPSDLLALCRIACSAVKLEADVRALASYGLQSAVPEISEAARRVLSGRSSLPPLALKPLRIVDDRPKCPECSAPEGEAHEPLCSRGTTKA